MQAINTVATTPPLATPEFITGEHTRLRPVLESDLPALARLLAEAPLGFSWEREPWTLRRLQKKYEDEKEPGLWGQNCRFYAITDNDGVLCGALREERGRLNGCDVDLHILEMRPDRDRLGPDALGAFVAYKQGWCNCPRIGAALLETQAERRWFEQCGFQHQFRCEESWLHRGELRALEFFCWLAPEVSANRAPDGIGQ